jgi:hypothetical protein
MLLKTMSACAGGLWEPPPGPNFAWASIPTDASQSKAIESGEVLDTLDLAQVHVVLEKTSMSDVQRQLGGTVGHRGDAGTSLSWLCYYQARGANPWIIWILSGEIHGGEIVHGFELTRILPGATPEVGCGSLKERDQAVLPATLKLGQTRQEVLTRLGAPSRAKRDALQFIRTRSMDSPGGPLSMFNVTWIQFDERGSVTGVGTVKTTTN